MSKVGGPSGRDKDKGHTELQLQVRPKIPWASFGGTHSRNILPGVQSINQFIFRIVIYIIIITLDKLVLSYNFRKICWSDVRRGNRCNCEFHDLVISVDLSLINLYIYTLRWCCGSSNHLVRPHDATCGRAGAGGEGERHRQGGF